MLQPEYRTRRAIQLYEHFHVLCRSHLRIVRRESRRDQGKGERKGRQNEQAVEGPRDVRLRILRRISIVHAETSRRKGEWCGCLGVCVHRLLKENNFFMWQINRCIC